jgi:spore germination protein
MYEVYKIKENDTLNSIAKNYGVDEDILIQINGLLDNNISNLEYLVVPQNKTPFQYYTVKKGDNIYNIAKEYNVDEDLLLKLNGLNKNDYIYPNQTIIIPRDNYKIYLTRQGDTLSNISQNYNIDIKDLMEENRNISVSPEQIIIIKEK